MVHHIMERYFQTFATAKNRTKWINRMKKEHPRFRVCFNEPTSGADQKMFEASGVDTMVMKYACIYRFAEE